MFDETLARRVRPLAEAFQASGIARLSLKDGSFELELRRAAGAPAPAAPPAAGVAPRAERAAPPADVLKSDIVGVVRFLRPQVNEGQHLDADRELAFVEALGIRNPVRSRGAGTVVAVFVTDGQPVEYGQPLFAIERAR
ncbi:MAG: acetyl-CoA carboxylase biotin carboxyl carrier protein subunit [Candidatus Velthaea sp.]